MANNTNRAVRKHRSTQPFKRQCALTFGLIATAVATALGAGPATAVGRIGDLQIVTRSDGQTLPVYPKDGRNWVVGTPGQEYSIRYCNRTAGRVLAVMSVDGVNVITGDNAAPSQSGYVLGAYECADIQGWRKNMARTAAFYFTELPDAYATRTGRPENVGVIGVAVFREKPPAYPWREGTGRIGSSEARRDVPAAKAQAGAADRFEADAASPSEAGASAERAASPAWPVPAPAPMSKLGTGHGRSEDSPAQMVRFERESSTPSETVAIHYDRRENLVAMGILPPPYVAHSPNPFPGWPHFVPDPPNR